MLFLKLNSAEGSLGIQPLVLKKCMQKSFAPSSLTPLTPLVLSTFLFSLHTDSLSSCHSRLLKYADDFMLCNSYIKCSDQEGLDDDLHRLVTWSSDHGLLISKTKCASFIPKNTSPQLPLSLVNGEALSRQQTVKNLGVHFNLNLIWPTQIDSV